MKSKKFLVMIMAATLTFGMVAFSGCRDNDKDKATAQTPTENVQVANDNMTMTEQGGNGIQMLSVLISPSEYANYGVSANAESARLVTASYTEGEYVSNPAVDWYVEFVNADSEWATGKKASDYVTVTPTSDGALTAVVEGLKAFGEQIRVVCKSRQTPELMNSFVCDYASLVDTLSLNFVCWDNCVDENEQKTYTLYSNLEADRVLQDRYAVEDSHMQGFHSAETLRGAYTLGTSVDESWGLSEKINFPVSTEFIEMVNSSDLFTSISYDGNMSKDFDRGRACLFLPGVHLLSLKEQNYIVYAWMNQHYGVDIPDGCDDGGVLLNEYLRIMNYIVDNNEGLEIETTLHFISTDEFTNPYGVRQHVEFFITFYVENPAEYFKAEASSLTLDTDHILFEP
jgi:hypothetical protein